MELQKVSKNISTFSSDNPETEAEFSQLIAAHGPNPRLGHCMASGSWQKGMLEAASAQLRPST
jgi:hypothetical protein